MASRQNHSPEDIVRLLQCCDELLGKRAYRRVGVPLVFQVQRIASGGSVTRE